MQDFPWRAGAQIPGLSWRKLLILSLSLAAIALALFAVIEADRREAIVALLLTAFAAAVAQLWPALDGAVTAQPMAPLIALVGCDGSGKSTLSSDLLAELSRERAVQLCYLGLGSGEIGRRIQRWPLIGPAIERRIARKAGQIRTKGQKIPGVAAALVVYAFSLLRLRRFRRMLALRCAGITVITDRYPQTDVPGFYDGPGLSAAQADNWLIAALARQERQMYNWMTSIRPDIVIRLNVDAETAHARKPDHRYELLQEKVAATRKLRFDGARIVDLDSCQPYEAVRAAALQIIGGALKPAAA